MSSASEKSHWTGGRDWMCGRATTKARARRAKNPFAKHRQEGDRQHDRPVKNRKRGHKLAQLPDGADVSSYLGIGKGMGKGGGGANMTMV